MFCQSEIEKFYNAARSDENIRRLQVAMNDSFGVRRFQSRGNLRGDSQRIRRRQRLRIFAGNNGAPSINSITR